jgi:hypothetical protein
MDHGACESHGVCQTARRLAGRRWRDRHAPRAYRDVDRAVSEHDMNATMRIRKLVRIVTARGVVRCAALPP